MTIRLHPPERGPSPISTPPSREPKGGKSVALDLIGGQMEDDDEQLSPLDFVVGILANAAASGLDLHDVLRAAEHADCFACWDEAVSLLGIGAIDIDDYLVVYVTKEE
jgi:hypothetical protein